MKRPAASVRKSAVKLTHSNKRVKATSTSAGLRAYKKAYRGGGDMDFHFPILQAAGKLTKAKTVLYPGCHRHLTMSLIFPNVQYIDFDSRVWDTYAETASMDYVKENRQYAAQPVLHFTVADFQRPLPANLLPPGGKVDLLVSMSSGQVAPYCSRYVRRDGFLLVSDAHADARVAFLMKEWKLLAVWDQSRNQLDTSSATLDRCFKVVGTGKPISKAQVEESIRKGSVSQRSFKLEFEPMFFLFKRR
mmetsp:Transcript_49579/g.91456  ORF Transcript_49579/g.91456 Transcript_49579/m.91456 type:complete len:247 (-) Transcript_49579:149-889(-)